ncbi:MAG TPA: hypothetical protein VKD19_08960 [Pseudolabrys sp.]|nr:hypothetical protein [Pseudolabrys sp.]
MLQRDSATYLEQTEFAVRHALRGIAQCENLIRGLTPPSQARSEDDVKRHMERTKLYFGRSFSEASLCGLMLQVAFMGIDLYSGNDTIPADCSGLLGSSRKAIRFCIGRRVHGIPTGLLIYAARNQFNHWDDESFDVPTSQVFEALMVAHMDNPLFDMAYSMNYPYRTLKAAHVVLNELRWTSYEEYDADMKNLLGVSPAG